MIERTAVKVLRDRAVARRRWAEAAVLERTLYSLTVAPDEPVHGQAEANAIEVSKNRGSE